ncbi:capsid portal protein [Canid alphaherpesvirus 1]|uniref:Capsid portal protein n=1 Tax=Canid alphaherpesvirus 1 TaxID=170325 RepID=A0A172DSD2_9ALPH|nr:capsid portal protein [Canid alphaherpesvirus 1]ALL25929.1 capsid portal protein [Canid alphaherpesvirus 1]ALL26085.1 capsid portal protein [Canid alphaherpesvirus 1]ARE29857.1 capsid portal protein [Canid alphaherpesvirus 1]QQL08504.1 capsid portal protein [Canid alphaherpesvirus 1]QQL08579.1 capsid portal protein [Canid alphaherpesvirus 1]
MKSITKKEKKYFESTTGYNSDLTHYSPNEDEGWILIHPTPKTMLFKEILMGNLGYTEGQGIYNSIRSTETAIRQIQATILNNTLNATRYEDLIRDWQKHLSERGLTTKLIAKVYGLQGEMEAVKVADQLFTTWYKTLYMSLLDFIRGITACFSASEPNGTASFAKYIDWIICLGMIPLQRLKNNQKQKIINQSIGCVDGKYLSTKLYIANNILREGIDAVTELSECANNVKIMDYDRVKIFYNFNNKEVIAIDTVTGEKGECLVIWQPILNNEIILFDSPLQRIHQEVLNCNSLREHARLCQFLNTAPIKVLIGKKKEEEKGVLWASKAVDKFLNESDEVKSNSSAAKLVKLIVNMKGMRHIGDITETVRSYLDETSNNILNGAQIDTTQPGFGQALKKGGQTVGAQPVQDAFRTSVINSINGMLESYINNLFKTIEELKSNNNILVDKLRQNERDLLKIREQTLKNAQMEYDKESNNDNFKGLDHDIIDISNIMGDDTYVANSFQSRYIPQYGSDLERLSKLWDQELIRCFKMNRISNNQGQEMSISYSNSSISLILAPYFFSILKVRRLGFLITHQEAYRSEEELCESIFKKTRLEAYLTELSTLFISDVKAELAAQTFQRKTEDLNFEYTEGSVSDLNPKFDNGKLSKYHRRRSTRSKFNNQQRNSKYYTKTGSPYSTSSYMRSSRS